MQIEFRLTRDPKTVQLAKLQGRRARSKTLAQLANPAPTPWFFAYNAWLADLGDACALPHVPPGPPVWSFRSMRQAAGAAYALTGHTLHLMVSSLDGHRSHLNRDRTA